MAIKLMKLNINRNFGPATGPSHNTSSGTNSLTSQQQSNSQQSNSQTKVLGFIFGRKCSSLAFQGKRSCSSCGGKK